ncbi:MAG: hypothetical protein KF693_14385 [Nitrospira sp.]|nr:hypothetical protein [Nitrospira sp.]
MSRTDQIRGDLPVLWLAGLGISVALFTVQPWSLTVYQVPVQIFIVWLLLGWLGLFRLSSISRLWNPYSMIQWLAIGLFLIMLVWQNLVEERSWLRFQQVCTGVALSLITAQAVISMRGRRVLLFSLTIAGTVSSIVAICQSVGMADWSWQGTLYDGQLVRRPSGLEAFPVAFSYSVVGIGIVLLGAAFHDLKNSERLALFPPRMAMICGGIILAGNIVALSRSGVLALMSSMILLAIGMRYMKRRFFPFSYVTVSLLVLGGLVIFDKATFLDKIQEKSERTEQDVRMGTTFSVFVPVIFQYPFGIPAAVLELDRHKRIPSNAAMRNTTTELKQAFAMSAGYEPHNLFLTVGLYYGVLGVVALGVFYWVLISQAVGVVGRARSRDQESLSVLAIVFLIANVGLLIHASFHNASIFAGEMRGWIWVGALGICVKHLKEQGNL